VKEFERAEEAYTSSLNHSTRMLSVVDAENAMMRINPSNCVAMKKQNRHHDENKAYR
jgi:hypothetical protein